MRQWCLALWIVSRFMRHSTIEVQIIGATPLTLKGMKYTKTLFARFGTAFAFVFLYKANSFRAKRERVFS